MNIVLIAHQKTVNKLTKPFPIYTK